jgi:putative ABC transport system permease protein
MLSFMIHLRRGIRGLAASPGFTLFAILTMALGLGVGTSIFEVFEAVLLRPLPYRDANTLVEVFAGFPSFQALVSRDDFESIRAAGLFERMALRHPKDFEFTGFGTSAPSVRGMAVSNDFFQVMGTAAAFGRTFSAADEGANSMDEPPKSNLAVLSHPFWRSLGSSPDSVGKAIRLDDTLYTVIGVMPPDFELLEGCKVWVPLQPKDTKGHGGDSRIAARLRGDLSNDQLKARLDIISATLSEPNMPYSYRLHRARDVIVGKFRPLLTILAGAILFVFLLACSNVSHLVLARQNRRRSEFAIRIALGAGRRELLWPLIAESSVICLCGMAVGLVLCGCITSLALKVVPANIPRLQLAGLNSQVMWFSAGLTVLSVLLVSILPAFEIFRHSPHNLMKGGAEPSGARTGLSRRAVLLVVNSALAMVLLAGAVLMLQTLSGLLAIDLGFSPKELFTAEISLSTANSSTEQRRVTVLGDMMRSIASVHGLEHVAMADGVPFGGTSTSVEITAQTNTEESRRRFVNVQVASSGLSRVYEIPFLAGRDLEPTDVVGRPRVALVSRTLAQMLWPGENPIGKKFQGGWGSKGQLTEVVGEVGDMRSIKLQTPPSPTVYLPYTQVPSSSMFIVARSPIPTPALASALSSAIETVDKDQRLENIRTGSDLLSASLREPKFIGGLLIGFSALALLLSAVGVYGVVSYWVAQSTREIGVRIALGARPAAVVRMVIGGTLGIVSMGLAAGLAIALGSVQVLSGFLYEVQPRNPVALLLGAGIVGLMTVIAASVPAIRAASVDPICALRCD